MPTKRELEENPRKYSMGLDIKTTKHHPYGKGAALRSPEELVREGYEANHNYAHTFKELNQLANLTHKHVFREAAELAHKKAYASGDYKKECPTCGVRHTMKEERKHKRLVRV